MAYIPPIENEYIPFYPLGGHSSSRFLLGSNNISILREEKFISINLNNYKKQNQMKVTHFIRSRQTGKTTELVRMFMIDPSNSIFIYFQGQVRGTLYKSFPELEIYDGRLVNAKNNNIYNEFYNYNVNNVFIDDYDMLNEEQKERLYEFCVRKDIENVFIMESKEKKLKKPTLTEVKDYIKFE